MIMLIQFHSILFFNYPLHQISPMNASTITKAFAFCGYYGHHERPNVASHQLEGGFGVCKKLVG